MKVLLVYPNVKTGNGPHYPHGLGALAAVAKNRGHSVEVRAFESQQSLTHWRDILKASVPDFVAFGLTSHQWKHVLNLAVAAKESGATTVVGGVHATFAAPHVLECPSVDMVVLGEGEGALADLLDEVPPDNIPNVMTRCFRNDLRPPIADLDSLPLYDRSDFPMESILAANGHELTLMSGRGCMWNCTYCCNTAWRRLYKNDGPFVRLRSLDHLFCEIDLLRTKYDVESLYFEDDIFTSDPTWVEDFCQEYPKSVRLPFRIYLRVECFSADQLKNLRDAGLGFANIGIESGSASVRRNILGRKMSNEQIVKAFEDCRKLGIYTRAFNMIGLPTETPEQVEKTMALNEQALPDQVQISIFHPYPGTSLFDRYQPQGQSLPDYPDSYFQTGAQENSKALPDALQQIYEQCCRRARQIEQDALNERFCASPGACRGLLGNLDGAVIEQTGAEPIERRLVWVGTDNRFCLFAHPWARIRFRDLPLKGQVFKSALALDPLCLRWGGGGVNYRLAVQDHQGERLVAQRRIDPKQKTGERGWNEWTVLLPDLERGDLILMTDPDPDGDLTGAWALWAEPRLEEAP